MKNRHVRFTATAQEHVRREKAWWRANRDHPDVFTEELEQALQIIAALPGSGRRKTPTHDLQLAKLLQVSQPRVSDLLRGRLHLFSIETLIDMLGRLGVQVRLVVKPTRRRQIA